MEISAYLFRVKYLFDHSFNRINSEVPLELPKHQSHMLHVQKKSFQDLCALQ